MNAYLLPEYSILSFSGGRTSGYMLHETLAAHGGQIPPGVKVVFCNTGKERPETLDFVERCSQRFGVPVTWLEYVATPSGKFRKRDGKELWKHTFRVVDYATASRNGEPFDMAIRTRGFLPNPVMRFCTGELKIKTTNRFVRHLLGWSTYTNAIGFRFDEPDRVASLIVQQKTQPVDTQMLLFEDLEEEEEEPGGWKKKVPGETPVCPLFHAGVTREDVMEFWAGQPFDLELEPYEGNCDGCLAAETEVITADGISRIADLAGQSPELLVPVVSAGVPSEIGHFLAAPVRSFGVQRLWKVELAYHGRSAKTVCHGAAIAGGIRLRPRRRHARRPWLCPVGRLPVYGLIRERRKP